MNKGDLVDAIAAKASLTKQQAKDALEAIIESVEKTLSKGGKVAITGFGTFSISKRKARMGINPKTKEKIKIAACKAPKFKAGSELKSKVR